MQMIAASGDYTNEVTFNQRVKNIGWDNNCVSDSLLDNPNFRDVRIYYNSYESVPSTDKKDPTYSTVWITCGSKNGAGFLVKLKNCVVCVTCNHILAECNESKPMAESGGMQHITFGLSLTDEYKKYPNDNLLSALDEAVISIPEWENNIPYDISSILELDDLEYCMENHSGQDTYCYGRIKGATPHWRHAGTIVGPQGTGYFQMDIENYNRTVDKGFSGGLVRTENNNVLVGIHEGSMGQHMGRLIPCRIIKEKIERMIHDGKL